MRGSLRAPILLSLIATGALLSCAALAGEQLKPGTVGAKAGNYSRQQLAEIVDRHATEAGVPAGLARAVVRVESEWDVSLTGSVGEIGLMQIRPETAREIGYRGTDAALYEPETNIRWGMKYLAGAYKLAGGDLCQTALKYQAGHEVSKMTGAARNYCSLLREYMASK